VLGFILLIISILLSAILLPVGWLYSLFTLRLSIKRLGSYFKTIAISIDQLGNVVLSNLLNDVLIDKNGYKFGDEDETISKVLGINKANNTLLKTGKIVSSVLNRIDKNHVEKASKSDN
tara:strand:- start:1 stop:357 length:357 start_codon:yes stop_codon:yes gene_type:complete